MDEAMQLTQQTLSKKQTKGIKASFDAMDINHDGKISVNELKQACKKLGILLTKDELDDIMVEADQDGNGTIDYKEYETLVGQQLLMAEYKNQQMIQQFRRFDKDGEGYITAPKIKTVFRELGVALTDDEVQELMDEADENRDGVISFEEFVNSVCEKDW